MTSVISRKVIEAAFAEAAQVVRFGSTKERAGIFLPVGPVTELRQRLALNRQEFARRYRIPLEQLDAWERGSQQPDEVAKAYLAVIAADPEATATALACPAAAAE